MTDEAGKNQRTYLTRHAARPSPPVRALPSTSGPAARAEPSIALRSIAPSSPTARGAVRERKTRSALHLKLIERLGPPSLIVDADDEVVHLSEHVAPFIQLAGGEPSTNLMRIVHPALRGELRAALFRARRTPEPAAVDGIAIQLDGEPQMVDVKVVAAGDIAPDFLLVTFQLRQGQEPTSPRAPDRDEPALRQLERELERTKRHLREVVEQYEASREELQACDEELQAMNEELQAMNEALRSATQELDGSREALESSNQELSAANQALQSKIDQLGQAHSDLHSLTWATAIATVFLDRELRIMRFTPPAVGLFSLSPSDIGRPLAVVQPRLVYLDLLADAHRVLEQLVPIEREVSEVGGRFFWARLLPYRTMDDRIAGVVLTLVDITERHVAQEEIRAAREELEQRVQARTADLDSTVRLLRQEVVRHEDAERSRQELQQLLVEAQEHERRRISRELHDEVGQQVATLRLHLKALETARSEAEMAPSLARLRATTDEMAREIHQLAFELRPVALDEMGLVRALSGLIDGWRVRSEITIDLVFAGPEEPRLPSQIETTLYRVVQEAINNVVKHAAAQIVSVSIERRAASVIALVEDDGKGFDPRKRPDASGTRQQLGILGMRERVTMVGGELTVESAPGQGTTIRVKLPLS